MAVATECRFVQPLRPVNGGSVQKLGVADLQLLNTPVHDFMRLERHAMRLRGRLRGMPLLLALVALFWCVPSFAVNRCTDAKGHVTYQDAPCGSSTQTGPVDTSEAFSAKPKPAAQSRPVKSPLGGNLDSAAAPAGASEYATTRGDWRGPVQFELSVGGIRDGAAHQVVPLVIEIGQDGQVIGTAAEAACKLSGLATQFVTPYMASIDVSLKGCRDERFNVRYSGRLNSSATAKEATLSLVGLVANPQPGKLRQTSLDAVLKR